MPSRNEIEPQQNRSLSFDWLVRGILTKLGDIFDRATGRGRRPSSSLATSELAEKLKALLDKEAVSDGEGRLVVPHNIQLNMQWDKFSTDSESSLLALQNELLVAAIDHINDRKYYTRAPICFRVRPDYFTSGVALRVSFEASDAKVKDAELRLATSPEIESSAAEPDKTYQLDISFSVGERLISKTLDVVTGQRLSVGRAKTNDLVLDDESVSKVHSSIFIDDEGRLRVADTGSTNGTFFNGNRISYGKSLDAGKDNLITFGRVTVKFEISDSSNSSVQEDPKIGADEEKLENIFSAEIDRKHSTDRQDQDH